MPFLVCEQWRLDRSLFLVGIHGQHKRKTQRKLDTHFLNVRPYGRTVPTRNLKTLYDYYKTLFKTFKIEPKLKFRAHQCSSTDII